VIDGGRHRPGARGTRGSRRAGRRQTVALTRRPLAAKRRGARITSMVRRDQGDSEPLAPESPGVHSVEA
jgi:hypothetical protein